MIDKSFLDQSIIHHYLFIYLIPLILIDNYYFFLLNRKKSDWADEFDEDDTLPAPQVTKGPDGIKTVITYRKDPATGHKVKVTQRIKSVTTQERVNSAVAERKTWAKYGIDSQTNNNNSPDGTNDESNSKTQITDPIELVLGVKTVSHEKKPILKDAGTGGNVKCRTCGGDHFTAKCPYKDMLSGPVTPSANASGPAPHDPAAAGAAAGASGPAGSGKSAYIAPHLRKSSGAPSDNRAGGPHERGGHHGGSGDKEETTLRVSNLSEDTVEDDLKKLFSKFGSIQRCNILRDRETGRSRCFGFVVFHDLEHAQKAAQGMNGYPHDNLIMDVDFANKREK